VALTSILRGFDRSKVHGGLHELKYKGTKVCLIYRTGVIAVYKLISHFIQ
jgi:hypothetical protein